jgi:alkanesulfonate monooxygenase SsuD/methylene tetrahydromethanopterin reductase-like flavin-dependent oxidoreductase (luciferase family)
VPPIESVRVVRTAQLGDGWLALWVSPRRFEEAAGRIEAVAARAGRGRVHGQHALQLWASFGASRARARAGARPWRRACSLPYEKFERYAPCGPPEAVAGALAPYVAVGCRRFNFVPEADSLEAAIEAVAEVKTLL